MSTRDWFHDDRKYAIVLFGAGAVFAIVETVRTGKYLDHGWIHPLVIGGILAGITCAGLSMRQEWSRWIGMATLAGGTGLVLWHTYLDGVSLATLGTVVGVPFCLWRLWTLPITIVQGLLADPEFLAKLREGADEIEQRLQSQERCSIVLLYRHALGLDCERLSLIAERAFGNRFAVVNGRIDPVDAAFLPSEFRDPVVAGAAPVLLCYSPPHLLGVYEIPSPYPTLSPEHKAHDEMARDMLMQHHAHIEIEVLPYVGNLAPAENGYACSGKLAAELMDDQCLAIYFPERDRLFPMSPTLPAVLRSSDPISALTL